jgi:hypothetical protein
MPEAKAANPSMLWPPGGDGQFKSSTAVHSTKCISMTRAR